MFITFEGGEGAGKTTQIKRLAEYLTAKGHEVITTREPGGTPEAEKIRNLIVQRDGGNWTPMAEVLLVFAAREMHVKDLIQPALDAGKIVICDRFYDSTWAYQGYGHGMDLKVIETIQKQVLGDFEPDFTFILDLPVEEGLRRSGQQLKVEDSTEDRFENLNLEFHNRLRQGFLDIAAKNNPRCKIINALQTIEEISAEIHAQL